MNKYRKKIIAGNWKMHKSSSDARNLAEAIKVELGEFREADVVLCPPFTALKVVSDVLSDCSIKVGAQNMHWQSDGAFTGEISAGMLRDLYCRFVILGHSERRQIFKETDEDVNLKVKAAFVANLTPIVCVGETLAEREAGEQESVVRRQLENSLAGVGADLAKVIVAYEPVWAIGTGLTASPEQAQAMHAFIRGVLGTIGGDDAAASIRIQYGGSVKPNNAAELFSQKDIDGGLIGGAALEAHPFVEIVRAAAVGGGATQAED